VVAILFITVILAAFPQKPALRLSAFQIADGSSYFKSSSGILYALASDTGELRWRRNLIPFWKVLFQSVKRSFGIKDGMPDLPVPVISDGVIIIQHNIRGKTSRLAALDAKTGEVLWTSKVRVATGESPIASSRTIYAPESENVVAMEAKVGKLKWQSEKIWQSDKIEMNDHVVPKDVARFSEFVDDAERVKWSFEASAKKPPHLLALEGDSLYVLMSASGDVLWDTERSAGSYSAHGYAMLALSSAMGDIRWKRHIVGMSGPIKVVAAKDFLFYQMAGSLYALSAETGKTKWQFEGGEIPYGCKPIVQDNTVYVAHAKRRRTDTNAVVSEDQLYAMELDTGKIKWQSPKEVSEVRGTVTYITPIEIDDYAIAADGTAYISTDEFILALDSAAPH
jgi:outer membrane protein assembly factor BamB